MENPLLRSGLALEGANRRQEAGGEDGILTALEVAGLDLWGTKLVVLSACETGVGEVRNGEGVYGLRRALVLAGSESQVMSLWQVADEATRDLMVSYYKRLIAGEGRTKALRAVQLEMLRGGQQEQAGNNRGMKLKRPGKKVSYSHPFFWAAFIQSGDWRAMSGQTTTAK
jgi:CHAT domain-containing protein